MNFLDNNKNGERWS